MTERSLADAQPRFNRMYCVTTTPADLFREWLARAITARGLSQAQLALRSGVDRSTVGRILNGDRRPTLDTAIRLVGALDTAAMPRVFARLGRLADDTDRVAQAFRDDPHLSGSNAAKLLRCYLNLRNTPVSSE